MNYIKDEKLLARKIPFEFSEDISPHWIPGEAELSNMINGASLTMPYLEPFLIKTIRESSKHIDDPKLKSEVAGFASQEGTHFRIHRQFNDILIEHHYPELREVEAKMQASYAKLSKRSLQTRMAYTAGFEAMTLGVTKWLIGDRVKLFRRADPSVTSFVIWHMVEETEHKLVAHDAYEALYDPSISSYLRRAFGVFHGSFDVMRFSMKAYKMMLLKDGLWTNAKSRLRLAKRLGQFIRHVAPFLLRAALPGHNPRREANPKWVVDWLNGYDANPDHLPLIDTNHPEMPVPFSYSAEATVS